MLVFNPKVKRCVGHRIAVGDRRNAWQAIFRQLVAGGYLAVDVEGHGGLLFGPKATAVVKGEAVRLAGWASRKARASGEAPSSRTQDNQTTLRKTRSR